MLYVKIHMDTQVRHVVIRSRMLHIALKHEDISRIQRHLHALPVRADKDNERRTIFQRRDTCIAMMSAVCGRVPPAGAFSIPTRWPAPPRREDLVNVRVGEGGPSARLRLPSP